MIRIPLSLLTPLKPTLRLGGRPLTVAVVAVVTAGMAGVVALGSLPLISYGEDAPPPTTLQEPTLEPLTLPGVNNPHSAKPYAAPQAPKAPSAPAAPGSQTPKTSFEAGISKEVMTLDAAAKHEDQVDWYQWYMSCRQYLMQVGGFRCDIGTPMVFYRSGLIEAKTPSYICRMSTMGKRFPLPANTKLKAVILNVRAGTGPPASRQEFFDMLKRTQQ